MKGYLRGHWGCGCDMAQCDVEEYTLEREWGDEETEAVGRAVHCHTHGLFAYALTGGILRDMDSADLEAVRRLNLLHEEDCR